MKVSIRPSPSGAWRILAAMDFDPWDTDPDSSDPPSPIGLDAAQQVALAERLRSESCDGSLAATRRWAATAGVAWPPLERALCDGGASCDCEVLGVLLHDEPGLP